LVGPANRAGKRLVALVWVLAALQLLLATAAPAGLARRVGPIAFLVSLLTMTGVIVAGPRARHRLRRSAAPQGRVLGRHMLVATAIRGPCDGLVWRLPAGSQPLTTCGCPPDTGAHRYRRVDVAGAMQPGGAGIGYVSYPLPPVGGAQNG